MPLRIFNLQILTVFGSTVKGKCDLPSCHYEKKKTYERKFQEVQNFLKRCIIRHGKNHLRHLEWSSRGKWFEQTHQSLTNRRTHFKNVSADSQSDETLL